MTTDTSRVATLGKYVDRHSASLARQGAVVASYRSYRGRRLGPYYRLECRAAGRKVSVYLGFEGPLVAAARQRLASLRRRRQEHRNLVEMQRQFRRHLKAALAVQRLEMEKVGLRLQGSEIRGYRSTTFLRSIAGQHHHNWKTAQFADQKPQPARREK